MRLSSLDLKDWSGLFSPFWVLTSLFDTQGIRIRRTDDGRTDRRTTDRRTGGWTGNRDSRGGFVPQIPLTVSWGGFAPPDPPHGFLGGLRPRQTPLTTTFQKICPPGKFFEMIETGGAPPTQTPLTKKKSCVDGRRRNVRPKPRRTKTLTRCGRPAQQTNGPPPCIRRLDVVTSTEVDVGRNTPTSIDVSGTGGTHGLELANKKIISSQRKMYTINFIIVVQ